MFDAVFTKSWDQPSPRPLRIVTVSTTITKKMIVAGIDASDTLTSTITSLQKGILMSVNVTLVSSPDCMK